MTQARIILNATGQELARVAAPGDYDALWYAEAHTPGLATMDPAQADWFTGVFDPSRIAIAYDLILEDALVPQVWQMSLMSGPPPPPDDGGGGDTNSPPYIPLGWQGGSVTNLKFVEISRPDTNLTLKVIVAYPDDFTNRISIITGTNLLTPAWSLLFTTNASLTTNTITFFDANFTANEERRFYNAYNADHDSDGDGVSDGEERFLLGTSTNNPNDPPNVKGTVSYGGRQGGKIYVVAVTNAAEWSTNRCAALCAPGAYQIPMLSLTNYWIKAWRDSNTNGLLDAATEAAGTNYVAGRGQTNVWIDFRAKIDPRAVTHFGNHPDIAQAPAHLPSVFAINRRGEIWAYDGATAAWSNDTRFIVDESRWHRFTFRQGYANRTWDLHLDGIRVFQGLGFRKWLEPFVSNQVDVVEFSAFHLAGGRGGGWYVDNLVVTNGQPSGLCGALKTADIRIAAINDDAEERQTTGVMDTTGGNLDDGDHRDLDMGFNTGGSGDTSRIVGLRFLGLNMAPTSVVRRAYVQFTERNSGDDKKNVCVLKIETQAADNAGAFSTGVSNISSRAKLSVSAAWLPPGWRQTGESNARHRTPDLSGQLRALVVRPGWQSGNAAVLSVTRTLADGNRREAVAYELNANQAAVLHIEWAEPLP